MLSFASQSRTKNLEDAMTSSKIARALLAAFGLLGTIDAAAAFDAKEVGSFHIGGQALTLQGLPVKELVYTAGGPPTKMDPNGDFHTGQMYVQYIKLNNPKARYPLLLWHGGGLTGVTWETKPDGQPGWQMYFINAGHDVYVSDAVERGRASWSRYPEVYTGEPVFRTKKEAWEAFRIGPDGSYATDPAARQAHAGQKFPIAAFDTFAMQSVPRWVTNDAKTQAAYNALVAKVCPCVIVVHSQGGNFGFNAALAAPDKVKALVAIEPSGAPPATANLAAVKDVPQLIVWGDFVNASELWTKLSQASTNYAKALGGIGGKVELVSLPDKGIKGNGHMLMMDTNSDQVAELIQNWMTGQGLMR
jgi:pimeloyl-ACP methyl ester carboxylesterase